MTSRPDLLQPDLLNLERMYRMNNPTEVNQLVHISLKDRYVYFKMPKVASTSLTATLTALECRDFPKFASRPHADVQGSVFIRPFQLPLHQADEIMFGGDYKTILFVRHPVGRFLSAYKHFLASTKQRSHARLQATRFLDLPEDADVSLDQFISILDRVPLRRMDHHYRPQALLSGARLMKHSFVGRLESLAKDMEALGAHIGLPVRDFEKEKLGHATGVSNKWRDGLTKTQINTLADFYKEDLEIFGYDI